MQVEIVTIGDELLFGYTIDTNAAFIGKKLTSIGIKVFCSTSIADNKKDIIAQLKLCERRSDFVIVTGGLGPTDDDITRFALADLKGVNISLRKNLLNNIKKKFVNRNRPFPDRSEIQAYLPAGAQSINNRVGLAPGIIMKYKRLNIIALPGVPGEVHAMIDDHVLKILKAKVKKSKFIHKTIRCIGIGETRINDYITNFSMPNGISVAYLPQTDGVDIRFSISTLIKRTAYKKILVDFENEHKDYIYGYESDSLEELTCAKLINKKISLSVAESCTGGMLSDLLTNVGGVSRVYQGGIIAYSNKIKKEHLKVKESTLQKYGAVSEKTALEMAVGIRQKFKSIIGISTTGIAGPSGGSKGKPVGTVCIGISIRNKISFAKKYVFFGNREQIKYRSARMAIKQLLQLL